VALSSVKRVVSLFEKKLFTGVAVALFTMLPLTAYAQGTYSFTGMTAVGSSAAVVNVPVTFTGSGVISSIRVLTGGIAHLDYTDTGAGTCTGSTANWISGQTCTVSVRFLPTVPGERRGAIMAVDSHGAPLAVEYLYAVGQGPVGVMLPGIISTVAGDGSWIYAGDGIAADGASIFLPSGVAIDAAGNLFIADSSNNRIRRVDAMSGLISTVAGNGNPGFSGDNGLAVNASIDNPSALLLDGAGNLYIADSNNNVVRMVNAATGIITTVAGIGGQQGRSGDGGAATLALLNTPEGLAFDAAGNLYIADTGNNVVRRVNAAGTISTFAGSGGQGYNGDGISATAAELNAPWGLAAAGNDLYIADLSNNRIRMVSAGIISTAAGTGQPGALGDGQSALQAQLDNPAGVAVDVGGNLYIADAGNNRVRKVNAVTNNISTIAGTGTQTFSGDGGPANQAGVYGPYAVTLDGLGNLYVADVFHNRIREIASTQSIQMFPAIRVGRVSTPQPQTFENDGNAPLIFTSIAGVTNGAVDAATTTCLTTTPLAVSTACIVGAEFAPTVTGKTVTGSINLNSNAANTPGTILLSGEVDTLDPTVVTLASSSNPAALGAAITFTSNVTASGTAPTGTVKFLDGTTQIGSATMNGAGTASFTTTSLSLGQHSITAVYSGDANSNPGTSTVLTESVKQTTATALTTSAASVVNGTSVTFTATVSAGVMPTGSVIFQDGTTAIGNGVLSAGGVATFTTTALTPGPHTITALYEGDGDSLTSTSAVVAEKVTAVTAVTVISSADPSSAGASVQFTATVTATGSNGSTGAITGAITFMDGSITLGTGTLSGSDVATFSTATLSLGAHSITASYAGGTYYTASTSPVLTQTVQQATTSTMLASSANPSIVNASVTFTATVVGTGAAPTGAVTFKDGATTLGTGTLNGAGKTSFSTNTLAVGSHSIVAAYGGDTNNVASDSTAMTQVVNKATSATVLVATPNPSSQGVYVQFTAVVTSNGTAPTGTVSFMEGTATLGSATVGAGGVATWSTNSLTMGQHTIVAVYQGDAANNTSTSASLQQNVLPVTSVGLSSNQNPGTAGAAVTFTATVTGQGTVPTGTITFRDGSTVIGTSALNGQGVATLTLSTLSVGANSITASYGGDAANASSTSNAYAETIQQATSQTVLTATASTITRGSAVTLTATVTSNGGTPGGSVAFMDNAQPLGTSALNGSGAASLTTSALTVGQHSITAAYAGDANDTGSNSTVIVETVSQASPSIQINSSINPSLASSGVTFTATLKNGVATPAGTVTWYDGTTVLGTSAMSASAASFNANTLTVGQHAISAAYSGDVNNAPATSGVLNQAVQQATTTTVQSNANQSIAGTNTHFTATVAGGSGDPVTGSVTFKDGANTLGTGAITNGVAVFDTTTLAVGLHAITAVYSGDVNSQASTSAPWTQSVTAATTVVTLTSSLNPSVVGAAVTFTAVVTGNGEAATGAVTFKDGTTVLGMVNITGGTAAFTTSALLPGQHSLVAQYGGDDNNQAAASPALTQTVEQRTTTTLQSGTNPAMTDQAITLTATVSNGGSSAATTGTVSFSDGATVLGTATLNVNGVATFAATLVGAGQHELTASYAGDTLNIGSNSANVTETVQLRASTTSVAASGTTVTTGAPLTLFAAVAGAAVTPTGTVTFYSGSTTIGSATLNASGVATLNYTPTAGTYSNISASYSGDAVYAASTSSVLGTITVGQALNFSITPNPSSLTVQSKQFGVINISLKSLDGFSDAMSIGCLGLPSGASCTFSSTQVNLALGGTQTVQVTLDTADPLTAGGQAKLEMKNSSMTLACGLPVGVLLGLLLWTTRKRLSKDGRRAMGGLLVLALTLLTIGLSGCGALQINGVAPGTYNVQVFATGIQTGITQSATITLTVTQ
jgi:hypothetical protein